MLYWIYWIYVYIYWMLYKELEKTLRQNAFKPEKKKPGLKFCPGLAQIGLCQLSPGDLYRDFPNRKDRPTQHRTCFNMILLMV